MADVGLGDLGYGFLVVAAGVAASLFLGRRLHKFITGDEGKDNVPRWYMANGASLMFFLAGFTNLPRIISTFYLGLISGVGVNWSEMISAVVVLCMWTMVGAGVGYLIGKMKRSK